MNVALCPINSSFAQSCLPSVIIETELQKVCKTSIVSFNINMRPMEIVQQLADLDAELYLFSCYIWNVETIAHVVSDLKKIKKCIIAVGGPEITASPRRALAKMPEVDFVIAGEAELVIRNFVCCLIAGENPAYLPNVFTHSAPNKPVLEQISFFPDRLFPYNPENVAGHLDTVIYYETMRGCPHNCTYCTSSKDRRLWFVPISKVKNELSFFIQHRAKLVKFVDRTFNTDLERAKDIISFILENNISTCFHLELRLDECDNELVEMLASSPYGWIQVEAGLQSINPHALRAVKRFHKYSIFTNNMAKLCRNSNIRVHSDIIAMLPNETFSSTLAAIDYLVGLGTHIIQLGFLKILPGTPLSRETERFGIVCSEYPPYEVFSTKSTSYDEYSQLKKIAFIINKYYNSGSFTETLARIFALYNILPQSFFAGLASYFDENGLIGRDLSKKSLYEHLFDFMYTKGFECYEELAYDYLRSVSLVLPPYLEHAVQPASKEDAFDFIKDNSNALTAFGSLEGLAAKEKYKKIAIVCFPKMFGEEMIVFVDEPEEKVYSKRKCVPASQLTAPAN
ncbi:MAG: B12-binding domain-containing radical SAM protein [Eubacteriaceae bacterium]|nr:B12-binding domain-containing radical SAM protein [Eubacteriaceae bacterium]